MRGGRSPKRTLVDRAHDFWARVEKTATCWLWTGYVHRQRGGYGSFCVRRGYAVQAHRAAWMLTHGALPDGLCVLHRCDVPPCVNPDHLFVGTHADNTADMLAKGRWKAPQVPIGEAHYRAKLTAEAVRRLRADRGAGARLSTLAARYGCSLPQAHRVVRRVAWKHV